MSTPQSRFVDVDLRARQRISAQLEEKPKELMLLIGIRACGTVEDLTPDQQVASVAHVASPTRLLMSSFERSSFSWKSGSAMKAHSCTTLGLCADPARISRGVRDVGRLAQLVFEAFPCFGLQPLHHVEERSSTGKSAPCE